MTRHTNKTGGVLFVCLVNTSVFPIQYFFYYMILHTFLWYKKTLHFLYVPSCTYYLITKSVCDYVHVRYFFINLYYVSINDHNNMLFIWSLVSPYCTPWILYFLNHYSINLWKEGKETFFFDCDFFHNEFSLSLSDTHVHNSLICSLGFRQHDTNRGITTLNCVWVCEVFSGLTVIGWFKSQ